MKNTEKKLYETPTMNIVLFNKEDILSESQTPPDDGDNLEWT